MSVPSTIGVEALRQALTHRVGLGGAQNQVLLALLLLLLLVVLLLVLVLLGSGRKLRKSCENVKVVGLPQQRQREQP